MEALGDENVTDSRDNAILSYQFVVIDPRTELCELFIYYPNGPSQSERLNLEPMIAESLRASVKCGLFDDIPDTVTVVGHFLRADLKAARDWPKLKKRVDAARGTISTLTKPLTYAVRLSARSDRRKKISIAFADTMLLAPQGHSSLKKLGETIGMEKVELPPGAIERMDLLLRDDKDLFEDYALTDAIVAGYYYLEVKKTLANKLGVIERVGTLAGAALKITTWELKNLGLSVEDYFGFERDRKQRREKLACISTIWPFASNCYHGGRNEAYWLGLTPKGIRLFDLDLTSAYTTVLATARVPDWSSARSVSDIRELAVVDQAMAFARVRFHFPEKTRFPSLPVRATDGRGLIYPLAGVSWCTGAELVVALAQGAAIVVEEGWHVDWIKGSPKPFEAFTRRINAIRKEAKARGDALLNLTAKEIGNSVYGKIAQGVQGFRTIEDGGIDKPQHKRVFDTRTGGMRDMPASSITNPMLAAYVTGMVRAALSEALAKLPEDAVVATATTDGFLSSVPVEQIEVSGPVALTFAKARKAIVGDATIWETKHVIGRALVTKTRGTITVERAADQNGDPVLARAGYKLKNRPDDSWLECEQWVQIYADREYNTKMWRKELPSLREQWLNEADLVNVYREQRLNLDFDMKREIIDPVDCDGLICADTRPWSDIEAFNVARDGLENWKKSKRRVLKTTADWLDLNEWMANRDGLRASGSTSQSSRPAFVNLFMRAMVRECLDARWPYKRLVDFLTENGFPTSVATVKQAKKRGDLQLGALTTLSSEEKAFAAAVYRVAPDLPLERLVARHSPAADALSRARQT